MTSVEDVHSGLLEIKVSFKDRVNFFLLQYYELDNKHMACEINESMYLRKLCPLMNEMRNINAEYKRQVSDYVATIPPIYVFEDILKYFDEDLL